MDDENKLDIIIWVVIILILIYLKFQGFSVAHDKPTKNAAIGVINYKNTPMLIDEYRISTTDFHSVDMSV